MKLIDDETGKNKIPPRIRGCMVAIIIVVLLAVLIFGLWYGMMLWGWSKVGQ